MKRILFATDFSPPSQHALDYACELASQLHSELHVLHVLQDPIPFYGEPGMMIAVADDYLVKQRAGAQRALDEIPPKERSVGNRTVRALRLGSPFVEIVRYAKEVAIDLIVRHSRVYSSSVSDYRRLSRAFSFSKTFRRFAECFRRPPYSFRRSITPAR